jgi:ribonuclease-3
MKKLQNIISYTFKNSSLLKQALTHSSYSNDNKKNKVENYERLEFLGDSILSLIVSSHLYESYKELPEGELTKLRASIVCEKSLYEFGKKINLGDFLLLSRGEEMTGGRNRPSIIADAFEAVIAAIYLDGGIEPAKSFILKFIPQNINSIGNKSFNDYKTTLQEVIQQNKEEKIEYVLTLETGPDHNKSFFVEVHLNSNVIGKGVGRSKKLAEQNAAKEALELMGYAPQ